MEPSLTPEEGRAVLRSILHRCPHDEAHSECQLCDIRKLSRDEQERWVTTIDDREAVKQAGKHVQCFWWKSGDR